MLLILTSEPLMGLDSLAGMEIVIASDMNVGTILKKHICPSPLPNLMLEPLTRLFISTIAHKVITSDIKIRTIWETYISGNASNFDIGTTNGTRQFDKRGKRRNSHCFRYECLNHLKKHIFPLTLLISRSEPLT